MVGKIISILGIYFIFIKTTLGFYHKNNCNYNEMVANTVSGHPWPLPYREACLKRHVNDVLDFKTLFLGEKLRNMGLIGQR